MSQVRPDKRVSDRYLGRGREYRGWQRDSGRFFAQLSAARFQPYVGREATVVDFGCGGGELLAGLDARERIGIEVNPIARSEAAERGIATHSSLDELDTACADVVISSHALEHVINPFGELVAIQRVLKAGGTFVLWLPIDDWRAQRRLDSDDHSNHLYTWTPQLIANLLVEAGFDVRSAEILTRAWPPRIYRRLHESLPAWLFDRLAYLTAVALRRRQLLVVAGAGGSAADDAPGSSA